MSEIKKKTKKKLPFYIFLGHLDEVTEKLGEDESNVMVLEDKAWILIKNQGKRLVWIVEPIVKNLKNSFMMYKDPQIYIFFNYHVKDMIQNLEDELRRADTLGNFTFVPRVQKNIQKDGENEIDGESDGKNEIDGENGSDGESESENGKKNITILGFNYNGKIPKMRKLRENVIEWCNKKNISHYTEFDIEEDIDSLFE
jgi:hypothetical protein